MLSFFPRDVLDEILNLIESVSEGFPTYSYKCPLHLYKMASSLFYEREAEISPELALDNHVCYMGCIVSNFLFKMSVSGLQCPLGNY